VGLRHPVSPYRLYLILESGVNFMLGIAYATIMVYWVISGRLNPLQLVLLGTVLELSYFLLQLPTGALADLVSRRLCVLAGVFIEGVALIMQGLSPSFANLLAGQAVVGLGAALSDGALEAWIADELPADRSEGGEGQSEAGSTDHSLTGIYLRGTQLGLVATMAGSLLSGAIALAGLKDPLLVAGPLLCLLAVAMAFVMPERRFRSRATPGARLGVAGITRRALGQLADQTRMTRRAIVAVPGLVLLFGMTLFVGLWSEGFDRLWGAFLLRDIKFPRLGGLHPALWFSFIACAVALLALASTEVARRRTARLGPDSVVGALLGVTLAIGAAAVVMATSNSFVVAVVAYLGVSILRPVFVPLVSGWMVGRIEPSVRATALSARDMFDSAGQIVGGPGIGLVGNLISIRAALLAAAAALAPAAVCIMTASRKIRALPAARAASAEEAQV